MNRSFALPISIFLPLAAMLVWYAAGTGLGPVLEDRDIRGLIAFIAVALIAEMKAVDFRLGGGNQQPHASMAFLPFIGMVAIFAPAISMASVAAVVGISQVLVRRNGLPRAIYNMAQAAVTAGASGLAFHAIESVGITTVVSFSAAAAVFFAANILMAGVVISYLKGVPTSSVMGHIASGLRYDVLASPIAAFPVALYATSEYSILFVVLPLLLVHSFHVSKLQLLDAHNDLVLVLIKAIETRDPYTSGHSVRVSTMAKMIASDMNLPSNKVRLIYKAALLHDIGKIDSVFSDVLKKPYSLTPQERALIETHSEKGAEMLQGLQSVEDEVIKSVLHHHERHDGKGYPHGLSGAEIPLPARIIMLCDSVDAMLSDRPYRKALSITEVHNELQRCAGSQFDPTIVDVMLQAGTLERAAGLLQQDRMDAELNLASVGSRLSA
jgi:putative nucleotidyltransferase with HDIG domain